MHVVITGAGGFVGVAMAQAFLAAGWEVTGICRKRRPDHLQASRGFSVVQTDLTRCDGLPERYDYLVHCAAEVPAYCADEGQLYRSNVEGTQRVFDHAAAAGARRIAYMSSMAVYGTVSVSVVDESTLPNAPDNYGRSKAAGEALLADWVRQTGGAGVSLRLPGVVGAGGRNNFLCDTLQSIIADRAIAARNPEALFNNILHVDDLAAWVVTLADRMPAGASALTVAAREPLTIRNTLARLYQRTGRKENINWIDGARAPFLIAFEQACALGFEPATVADAVDRFVADVLAMSRYS